MNIDIGEFGNNHSTASAQAGRALGLSDPSERHGGFQVSFSAIREYRHLPRRLRLQFTLNSLANALDWGFLRAETLGDAFEDARDFEAFLLELGDSQRWTEPAHFRAFIRAGIYPRKADVYDYTYLAEMIRKAIA